MLKKYKTDSHVIYGTLRLEIFTKYPLITRESKLFADIRFILKTNNSAAKEYVLNHNASIQNSKEVFFFLRKKELKDSSKENITT